MTEGDKIVANILINLVYTLLVLLLPFAIYRRIKGEPISPKKARRIVISYMIIYSVLHFVFCLILVAFGVELDGKEAAPNFAALLLWYYVDIKILTKGYYDEEEVKRKENDAKENAQCETAVKIIEQKLRENTSTNCVTNSTSPNIIVQPIDNTVARCGSTSTVFAQDIKNMTDTIENNRKISDNSEFIQSHNKKTVEQNIALFSNISAVVLSITSILGIILAMNFQDSRRNLMESWSTTTVYFVLLSLFCIFLCFSIISLKKHSFKLLPPLSCALIATTIIVAINGSVFSHSFYNSRRYVYDNNDIIDIFNAFWVIGSILIFVITLLPTLLVLFKNVKCKWHKSIRYRERCYKRVSKLHQYFESGIITEEEFLSAKNDIIKNIER